ncbi:MAG: excinuclease ABC subunit UvrC [Candidatus Gracilibacteria bacterium]|nr:excinuclease ABC subunit UvrC [Candidatus Gracilibacteria bacterium]
MNNTLKNKLKNLPRQPGIYKFLNTEGKIIYIGKSVNLFNRINSYFKPNAKLNFGKKKMVSEIIDLDTIIVNNEKESLILETTLIKKHKPKYNILMKDDKNHLYIKVTDEIIPRVLKTRIKTNSGTYFGPYISSSNVNNILKVVKKIFGYRSCNLDFIDYGTSTEGNQKSSIQIKSVNGLKIPCIDYYTKRCSGPCLLGEKEIIEYRNGIENIKNFINGDFKQILEDLNKKMLLKAKELKFEEANLLKQDIESIKSLEENQIVRDYVEGDYDIINYIEKYDKFFIGLASIRNSKITDLKNYEVKTHLGESVEEILLEFIEREINLDEKQTLLLPIDLNLITLFRYEIPKVGPKFDLLKFVYKNIYEYAYRKHIDSLSTKGFTKQTMKNLLYILGYKEINKDLVFECNDISHLSGTNTVASRSIIENGKPNKNKYRKFNIKTLENLKIDDFSSMKEIMQRRLKELIEKNNLPDLIIIDGGVGQLNSVIKVIEDFKNERKGNIYFNDSETIPVSIPRTEGSQEGQSENQDDRVLINLKSSNELNINEIYSSSDLKLLESLQIVSIAKREEELFLPGIKDSIVLDKDSNELRLIQKIRDEAHRFAITFNKEKRLKSEKRNILESIPGIGQKTRSKLIKKYGNIDNLKNISHDELKSILNKNQIEALENHSII